MKADEQPLTWVGLAARAFPYTFASAHRGDELLAAFDEPAGPSGNVAVFVELANPTHWHARPTTSSGSHPALDLPD